MNQEYTIIKKLIKLLKEYSKRITFLNSESKSRIQ